MIVNCWCQWILCTASSKVCEGQGGEWVFNESNCILEVIICHRPVINVMCCKTKHQKAKTVVLLSWTKPCEGCQLLCAYNTPWFKTDYWLSAFSMKCLSSQDLSLYHGKSQWTVGNPRNNYKWGVRYVVNTTIQQYNNTQVMFRVVMNIKLFCDVSIGRTSHYCVCMLLLRRWGLLSDERKPEHLEEAPWHMSKSREWRSHQCENSSRECETLHLLFNYTVEVQCPWVSDTMCAVCVHTVNVGILIDSSD